MNSSKSRKTPFSLHIFVNNFTDLTHHKIYVSLKGPKHEIFENEFFTQIRPEWLDDLGTGEQNRNFACLSLYMKIFAANILLSV
jgi:hypothetical protein